MLLILFLKKILADEINKVLKATFAKAMANNPNAAADMARCMAEAMAASGASAEEIAATMQEALNSSLCNIDGDSLLHSLASVGKEEAGLYLVSVGANVNLVNTR